MKTKVLMLSATPVNNRFTDLQNQLALAYEGESENLSAKARTRQGHRGDLPPCPGGLQRLVEAAAGRAHAAGDPRRARLRLLRAARRVTIARSRKHIQTFYDTKDIGTFPERLKPISFHCQLTDRPDVIGFNEIFEQLSMLTLAVYAPLSYVLPSRLAKYEELYDTEVSGGGGKLRQADREKSLQALDDGQPAQAAGELGRSVPAHAAEASRQSHSAP